MQHAGNQRLGQCDALDRGPDGAPKGEGHARVYRATCASSKAVADELRQQRIRRYRQLQRELDEAFQASISRMIHSEMALGSQGEATAAISSRS